MVQKSQKSTTSLLCLIYDLFHWVLVTLKHKTNPFIIFSCSLITLAIKKGTWKKKGGGTCILKLSKMLISGKQRKLNPQLPRFTAGGLTVSLKCLVCYPYSYVWELDGLPPALPPWKLKHVTCYKFLIFLHLSGNNDTMLKSERILKFLCLILQIGN